MLKAFVFGGIVFGAVLVWMWTVFAAHTPSVSADYASWAQAFGTVGAVFVALVIPFAQHGLEQRVQQRKEREAHAMKVEAAYQLAFGLQTVCGKVLKHVDEQNPVERATLAHSLGELQAISTALSKFNPGEFDKHDELMPIYAALSATMSLAQTLSVATERADQHSQNAPVRQAFATAIDSVKTNVKVAADRAKGTQRKGPDGALV
jgi:hypothetical protein